jgi:hypothetical protein
VVLMGEDSFLCLEAVAVKSELTLPFADGPSDVPRLNTFSEYSEVIVRGEGFVIFPD